MKGILTRISSWLFMATALNTVASGCNWMTSLDGHWLLSQLSIPGSHDAMALYEPFPGTTKCQNLSLAEQLKAGVRFLDIRCRHTNNAFGIYHGRIAQSASFDDVLNTCASFLKNNPGECIVMSVKQEHTPDGNTRSFEQTFDSYVSKNAGLWHLGSDIPTLGAVRGKIVLFRRFAAKALPKGIDASVWPDNTTFTNRNLIVEDHYELSDNDTKWRDMTNLLNIAVTGGSASLYVTFASGFQKSALGIPSIPAVADDINVRLANYFKAQADGCYGIILMDFADASRCSEIIATNAKRRAPHKTGSYFSLRAFAQLQTAIFIHAQ